MAAAKLRAPNISPGDLASPTDYRPEEDVERLAEYFAKRYGSLEKALDTFDPSHEFDLYDFEAALKKWGVKVGSVVQLFDHLDVDWSGKISIEELFVVLQLPAAELQEREQRRRRDEIKRTLEQIAQCLRRKYQSVEEAVARHSPQDPGALEAGALSLARLRNLVNGLGLQVDAALLQQVFNEVDHNCSGSISIAELQRALSSVLVRDELTAVASALAECHGGDIDAAFRDLGEMQLNSVDMMQRLLRHLGKSAKLERVTDDRARLMFSCLSTNTVEEFVSSLKEAYRQSEEQRQRQETERKRREHEQKRQLRRALVLSNGRQQVQKEVQSWAERAATDAGEATLLRKWEVAARGGTSALQLKDYVSVLKDNWEEAKSEASGLRLALEKEAKEVEFLAPTPTQAAGLARSGEVTPMSPCTPYLTPAAAQWSAQGQTELSGKSKAEKAQRLAQAASAGDVQAVAACLNRRADVDLVAWGGHTPLMVAAHHGRQAVLELLVARQADLLRTDLRGRTAIDHARRQPRARKWLQKQGGLSSAELQQDAELLAQLLQEAEEERSQLRAGRELQAARLRQVQRHNLLEAQPRFGMPQGSSCASASPTSEMSPGMGPQPGPQPLRSALAGFFPSGAAERHVQLDCLPQRQ